MKPTHEQWEYAWLVMTGQHWTPLWMRQLLIRWKVQTILHPMFPARGIYLTTTL